MYKLSVGFSLLILLAGAFVACNEKKQRSSNITFEPQEFVNVDVNLDSDYYDSLFNIVGKPELIALKENEETMFADLNKMIVRDGKYFILDAWGGRTVVSFNADGTPLAKYGRAGRGPEEYVRPWDMDVRDGKVYILDSNLRKVLIYRETGEFVSEKSMPFIADAISVVGDNRILFNVYLQGKAGDRVCLTDSNMQVLSSYLPTDEGHLGGFRNCNTLSRNNSNIAYFTVPSDTMFVFDNDAQPARGIVFDYGSHAVPDIAHYDYMKADENNMLEGTWIFEDTPMPLAGGIFAETLSANHRTGYVVLFNPSTNRCGGKKYSDMESVYDILTPCAADEKGNLISYADIEDLQGKEGYDDLPDSIKSHLEKNNRILLIYPFSKLSE